MMQNEKLHGRSGLRHSGLRGAAQTWPRRTRNFPISCGGVAVKPGDAILADENGVLVLAPGDIEAAASRAIAMQTAEKTTLRRLDAGEKLPDITGASQGIRERMAKA